MNASVTPHPSSCMHVYVLCACSDSLHEDSIHTRTVVSSKPDKVHRKYIATGPNLLQWNLSKMVT